MSAELPTGRRHLPARATSLRLPGVDYVHLPTHGGGDLYVTWHGIHLLERPQPENWHESDWFRADVGKDESTVLSRKSRWH